MSQNLKYLSQLERFSDGNRRCVTGSRVRVSLIFYQTYVVYYGQLADFLNLSIDLVNFNITPTRLEINPTTANEVFVETFCEFKVARTLFSVNKFKQYGIFERI